MYWTNDFCQVLTISRKKYPRSMRLNFFNHRTLFWSPNRHFQSNCAHFWWAGSTLAIIGDKIKKMTERNTVDKFYLFPKKKYPRSMRLNFFNHQTMFCSPNRQFQSNCAHFWWAGSTLAIVVDKIKKWTEQATFDKFYLFPGKSIRARWGSTSSITEHCFGHQIVNFIRIVLIFVGQAPL